MHLAEEDADHSGIGGHHGPRFIVIGRLEGGSPAGIVREPSRELEGTLDVSMYRP